MWWLFGRRSKHNEVVANKKSSTNRTDSGHHFCARDLEEGYLSFKSVSWAPEFKSLWRGPESLTKPEWRINWWHVSEVQSPGLNVMDDRKNRGWVCVAGARYSQFQLIGEWALDCCLWQELCLGLEGNRLNVQWADSWACLYLPGLKQFRTAW